MFVPLDKTHSLNEVFSIDANLTGKETIVLKKEQIFLFMLITVYPVFRVKNMRVPRAEVWLKTKFCQTHTNLNK